MLAYTVKQCKLIFSERFLRDTANIYCQPAEFLLTVHKRYVSTRRGSQKHPLVTYALLFFNGLCNPDRRSLFHSVFVHTIRSIWRHITFIKEIYIHIFPNEYDNIVVLDRYCIYSFDLFSFNSPRAPSKPKTRTLLLKPPSHECSLCLTMHISTLLR